MDEISSASAPPPQHLGMRLTEVSFDRIQASGMGELYDLAIAAGIQDYENLDHSEDLRERLILMKRKMEGSSNTWRHLFQSVREETNVKSEILIELMKTVEATFQTCPIDAIDSLSDVLRQEGHLRSRNLLQEISKRIKNLVEHKSLIIIAGETNGGKSTFLNLLLGEDILPTDVLHCTFSICKIVYSDTYSIKTVDHNDQMEYFLCASKDQAKALLKSKVAQQGMKERVLGSPIKEITLGMPADILKSGVTLVDTPGIGEDENMDNVTMNFVKSTHASAFIYIIKSDTAGGVQEDRLLDFLRAIKDRYSTDTEVEAFDPKAAIFVCHRWDNIDQNQREKVKNNALEKLEYVWPGFEPSQTYFFSTTKTLKHLPLDPEYVTDSFMNLLKGLKQLFERASHNAIKYHYLWLKHMLQPASHHLRSMITLCIHNNDELEIYFKNVAIKQNRLMQSSEENSIKLQRELDILSLELKDQILLDLNFDNISIRNEIHDCQEIIKTCSQEHFLYNKKNRQLLDEIIIRCLLKYVDEHVQARKTVNDIESKILMAIQDHLGLFRSQIKHIKNVMLHGGRVSLTSSQSRTSLDADDVSLKLGASTVSTISTASNNSSIESFSDDMIFDTTKLALTVKSLLLKRKNGKSRSTKNSKREFQESLMSKLKSKIRHGIWHTEPALYVEERMHKVAKDIREDMEIMDTTVHGYTDWIQRCVNYATNSIPKFIEVNNKLMDVIREQRTNFQRDKGLLWKIMEDLEPSRHHLKGYGLLFMDDINAEMLAFTAEHWNSSVFVPKDLVAEHRPNDDSGFQGSGSKKRKVQSLWAKMKGATITVNNMPKRVVVKTYIYDMDDTAVLSEIASLRCLEFTNLASFLGMTRILATGSTRGVVGGIENFTEKVSAFIFKGDLVSASVYSRRKMTNMQLFVPVLIHDLLQGLNYLHRQGLVHMELNLDTVMVRRMTGKVKLCLLCKPREARFPASLNTMTQSCVCLSPNVLQGHVYESTDDMYAFGLLLWEILFPDEPPYKVQRSWSLKRFIEECHPTNMLQDSLMRLKVSENVRDVLKGTLLLSRGTICMPIATIQSSLVDISNEPAVHRMRSRRVPMVYRRISSELHLGVAMTTTSVSEVSTKSPLHTEEGPHRPPRKKDMFNMDVSKESPDFVKGKNTFPPKDTRRQSEPVLSKSLFGVKSKTSIFSKLSNVFGRRSSKIQLNDEFENTTKIVSAHRKISTAEPTYIQDDKITSSVNNEQSSPMLKPKLTSKYVRKETADDSKSHSRRLSLQDHSLIGPKKVSLQEDENFDVPRLMLEKFPTNWSNSLNKFPPAHPLTNLHSNYFLNGSLPSLPLSDEPARNEAKLFNKKHSIGSITDSRAQSRFSDHKQLVSSMPLDSKAGRIHVPMNVSMQNTKQFGRSLQNLSNSFSSQVNHTTGMRTGNKYKSANFQHISDRFIEQRLANSLQDVSDTNHSINPIMEEKGDTSVLFSDHAGSNVTSDHVTSDHVTSDHVTSDHVTSDHVTSDHVTSQSFHKNYGHNRFHSPVGYRQSEKLSPPTFEAAEENEVGSSFSLASSSSSSLGHSSGFSTDLSGQEQMTTLGLADISNVDFSSEPESVFKRWSNTSGKMYNYRRNLSFEHKKRQSIPTDNFTGTSQTQDPKTYLLETKTDNYSESIDTNSPEVFSADSLPRTTNFSFLETNHTSEPVGEKSASRAQIPPPPPAIDFSKLFFGKEDNFEDD